jgi:hypothetical protein
VQSHGTFFLKKKKKKKKKKAIDFASATIANHHYHFTTPNWSSINTVISTDGLEAPSDAVCTVEWLS